ncbi:MAG TPA: phosphatase PAP2 family protein, partial [Aliiroseovarius sp.]|nr:phosphatase PAP2 family protein [Aliiroseovarius sp.]
MWRQARMTKAIYRVRRWIVVLVLAIAVGVSLPSAERIGDRLQIALPVLGLGCAVLTGGAGEYLLRYVAGTALVQGSKAALGQTAINQRPRGGYAGFPSGHTAAASFGASALVNECVRASPLLQGTVILAAGFTGASRIEAGAHTIWQVLAGAVIGFLSER